MKANPKGETSSPTNMPLTKAQKQKILDELKEKIAKQKVMIFADFTGLKVKDLSNLRKKIKAADGEIKVAKKTLLGLAAKSAGLEFEAKKIKGEIAMVFGYKDEISLAKIIYQFASANPNLKILGGFLENQFREAQDFITLAQLPTKEELLARLARGVSAPISNFINVLQAPLEACIFIIRSLGENKIGK